MTSIIDHEMLWRQFGAAIDDFGNALRDCPDELWEERLWEDQPDQWVAIGFSTYWYLCYHTLFWPDLHSTGAEEGFAPPALPPVEMASGEVLPADLYAGGVARLSGTLPSKMPGDDCALSNEQADHLCRFPGHELPFAELLLRICVTCKSMLLSYACSWDSRRKIGEVGISGNGIVSITD